jgi:transposase
VFHEAGGRQRRRFSREFKLEAVKLVREREVSAAQPARDLVVHENVLRKGVKELGSDPVQAFPGQGQMKPEQLEIERLRREVNKLKAERDVQRHGVSGETCWQTASNAVWLTHVFVVQVDQIAKRANVPHHAWLDDPLRSMLRSISSAHSSPSLRRRKVSATYGSCGGLGRASFPIPIE